MRGRIGVLILAVLAPAVALAVDPGGWYPFGPVKWLMVSVLVPAGVALVLVQRPLRLQRGPTVAAAVLVAWLAVAAVFGDDPIYAWTGTPERHLGVFTWVLLFGVFVAGQSLDAATDGPVVAEGLAWAGLGTGLVATLEALGWEPSVLDVDSRLSGTFGSPAYLGAAAVLLLPALVGIAADRTLRQRTRIVAAAGVGPLAVACIGSGARAAWVGLAVALVMVGWARRRALISHRGRALTLGAAALVAAAALLVFSPVDARLGSTFDRDAPGGEGRLDEWRVATRVIARHSVVGVGPEGYRIAFAEGVDAAYERAHGRDPLPDRAHSGPLDVALAGGLPALAAWLALVVLVGRSVVGHLRGSSPLLVGLAAALVAHVVGQLLLFPTFELEPVAWLLAGLLLSPRTRRPPCPHHHPPGLRPGSRSATPVASSLAAVVAVIGLVAGVLDVTADRRAAGGDGSGAVSLRPDVLRYHLLEAQTIVAANRGTLEAIRAVDEGLDVSPDDPIARLRRAELLVARARATQVPDHIDAARTELERLLDRDPDNAALLLQAGAAAQLAGDVDEAEHAWATAADLAPKSAAPLINLALLHLEAGRFDEAEADLDRAATIAPDDPRVADVRRLIDQTK